MLTQFKPATDPFEQAYAICKEHAVVEGAFSELLMRHWFQASWDLCAEHVGLIYPAFKVDETVKVNEETGTLRLSYKPTSFVELYSGVRHVATMAPNSPCFTGEGGCAELCCHCWLRAIYTVGTDLGCNAMPPRFIQAVARLFTYIAENRGEMEMDEAILGKSGAKSFLGPELTYVL